MRKTILPISIFLLTLLVTFLASAQFGRGDIVFKIKDKIGDVLFSHKIHAGFQHINCEYCHNLLLKPYIEEAKKEHKKTSDEIDKLFCNNCHDGKKAFSTNDELSCKRCHSYIKIEDNTISVAAESEWFREIFKKSIQRVIAKIIKNLG